MATAQEPTLEAHADASSAGPAEAVIQPVETQSTRLMLTTAAHFVQQHLHAELAELDLTPLGLSVLSGLAELPPAAVPAIATQCVLSRNAAEQTLEELLRAGLVGIDAGLYSLTAEGRNALTQARGLEDALFAETSATLRLELGALISRLREGGVLDSE